MPIRVHQLAKEFKISTSALKKHLADLGVDLKSHMSPVDDEIVKKIRDKFNEEKAIIKQRQQDSRSIHQKIILAGKAKEETTQTPLSPDKGAQSAIPRFVEKRIKKTEVKNGAKTDSEKPKTIPPKPAASESKKQEPVYKEKKLPIEDKTTVEPKFKEHEKKEEKAKEKKYEDKNKHLNAKLKSMKKGGRKKKFEPTELEEAEIAKNIKKTLTVTTKKKKYKKDDKTDAVSESKVVVSEFTSVSELAKLMNVSATEIITKFFMMGQMVTINQRLDKESLEMICDEFKFDVEFEEEYGKEILEEKIEVNDEDKVSRPPIVTIMGHVDHGKTAILDRIRSSNVIAGESGGITQHIGAYQVDHHGHKITFLDTPGHEAFAAMRARGANITDIAVIVVAANESVKKQTIEAIDHAKAAGVNMIVAINKMDLRDANVDRVMSDLMKQNLRLEGYGGDMLWVKCSAETGEGIEDLLEAIILSSEMLELKAAENVPGKAIVIESSKDQRKGSITTVLVQEGTLKKGDNVVCGATFGRIRRMENERGTEIELIKPADVAVIYGLNDVPKTNDILNKVDSERQARLISTERKNIRREREKFQQKTSLSNLYQKIKEDSMSEIKLIVKADTDGSLEALCDSLQNLSNEEVAVHIIRKAVGGINEADVNMASASDAIIIGFHVRANNLAKKMAEDENIEIKNYNIIYEAIEEMQKALIGMLKPETVEKFNGTALVKQVFRIKKVGTIAGCYVEKGMITNTGLVRLYREDVLIHEGKLHSLKHYADEVKAVKAGSDCGIGIENFNDIKEGDIIENFVIEEVARKM